MRSKKKEIEALTDDELHDLLPLDQCDHRFDHPCDRSCPHTESKAVRELWDRYERLKNEFLAELA